MLTLDTLVSAQGNMWTSQLTSPLFPSVLEAFYFLNFQMPKKQQMLCLVERQNSILAFPLWSWNHVSDFIERSYSFYSLWDTVQGECRMVTSVIIFFCNFPHWIKFISFLPIPFNFHFLELLDRNMKYHILSRFPRFICRTYLTWVPSIIQSAFRPLSTAVYEQQYLKLQDIKVSGWHAKGKFVLSPLLSYTFLKEL